MNAQQDKIEAAPTVPGETPTPFYPFACSQKDSVAWQQWLTDCMKLPGKFNDDLISVIKYYCLDPNGQPVQTQICQDWWKRFDGQGKLPLPRKVSAGLSIGLGVTSIVLGVLHLSFPLFKSLGNDCSANGLRVPCIAGRYELGGALIGVGVVIGAVGGGLSLGLPHD